MAEYRKIHTRMWKDEWFSDLDPDAKLLFIYLFSNEQAEVSGVYELPIKYMAFEVGITKDRVISLLADFESAGKVFYRNGWVWVVNLRKHNETASEKVQKRITTDLYSMPTGELKEMYCKFHSIPYTDSIDTVSIPEHTETETEIETDKETDKDTESEKETTSSFDAILSVLNSNGILPSGEKDVKVIQEMERAGCTPEDVNAGIQWLVDHGTIARYASSVSGPAQTEMRKRLQQNGKKQESLTDYLARL